jgi:hypothetical protein
MNASRASRTIDRLFEAFLADHEIRCSPKIFARYEAIIRFYRSYLERGPPGRPEAR